MEKPIYPSTNMRITQGYNEGTHKDSYAIDDAGSNTGIGQIRAPFTGIIKKIYKQDANEVWLESIKEVEYPNGIVDYMTIMFAHANDVSNLYVGKKINQGENFYSEGTKGNATGNHCHIECGQGKFNEPGWHQNSSGYYSIDNARKPEDCLWIDGSVNIMNNHNYSFKQIEIKEEITPPEEKPENPKPTPTPEKKPLFICKEPGLYGIYLKKDQKLYLE